MSSIPPSGARILLVEDDAKLGAQIADQLRRDGFEVDWLQDGAAAIGVVPDAYQLVVLDLMLPGASGFDVLRVLRSQSDVPVLVLSARNETDDKVRALRLGADDFVTKPFWPEELAARARARLRRPVLLRANDLRFGELSIDVVARRVAVGAERVDLTHVEFEILAALARRPDHAIDRVALARRVLAADDTRGLDAHVSRLRKKLGPAARRIATVWGVGYRLESGGPP